MFSIGKLFNQIKVNTPPNEEKESGVARFSIVSLLLVGRAKFGRGKKLAGLRIFFCLTQRDRSGHCNPCG